MNSFLSKTIVNKFLHLKDSNSNEIKKTSQFLERLYYVGLLGLEPRKTAPKTVVLPLHHRPAVLISECKFNTNFILRKLLNYFYQKTFSDNPKKLENH